MSDTDPRSLRDELEIRVVALLTGELSEVDADALEQILTVDAELSAYRDRMAVLIGHVHDARDEIAPPLKSTTMRLSPERRAEIFKDVDAAAFDAPVEPKEVSWKMRMFEIAAVIAILFILAAIFIPTVGAVKKKANRIAYADEAYFEEPPAAPRKLAPQVDFSLPASEKADYIALETEIPAELIEGTPQPVRYAARRPVLPTPAREALIPESSSSSWSSEALGLTVTDKLKEEKGNVAEEKLQDGFWNESLSLRDGAELGQISAYYSSSQRPVDSKDIVVTGEPESFGFDADQPGQDYALAGRSDSGASSDAYAVKRLESRLAEEDESRFGRASGGSVGAEYLREVDASSERGIRVEAVESNVRASTVSVDAFAAPASGGYAGERSNEYVDSFAAPTRPDVVFSRTESESQQLEDAITIMGNRLDGYGVSEPIIRPTASMQGPVDAFASSSLPSVVNAPVVSRPSPPPMDAFVAPSGGGYAGERSKSNADPFAGPAHVSEKPADLLKRGRKQYLNGDYDGASATFSAVQNQDPSNREAQLFRGRIDEITDELGDRQTKKTREQMLTEVDQAWERPKVFDISSADGGVVNASIGHKSKSIVIPEVNFSGVPLSEVIATLNELSVEYDPDHVGVPLEFDPDGADPRVNISLRNLNLDRIMEFVTQQVNYAYDVTEDGIRVERAVSLANSPQKPKATLTPKAENQTADAPISTFSLNVSDVSFKLAEAALANSRVPDASQIRSEEFVNSFDYRDPVPRTDEAVSLNWEIADLPYAHGRQVIRFSLQTQAAGRMAAQPLNLHLLVDNSGSMQRPDRRAILEQSLQSLKDKLQPNDELSIVLFARQPKLIANASTHEAQQVAVDQALAYRPEGGTNLEAGLSAAYENAQRNFDPAASNRVILMTDGAANLGDVNGSALAEMVVEQRKQGVALDAFGIGWDDYNDALLEEITRNGDGRYGFLNSADDAAQDFSEKLAGSLRVAAADVKVQVIWNPERVTTYRQVGYDLHQLKTEDFRDNTVDAAEIGEAEAGTALYVVQINEDPNVVGSLGTLQVRYRDPATGLYHEQQWPLEMPRAIPSLEAASPALRLATASALFAERLAKNPYAQGYSFSELTTLTNDLPDAFPTQQRVVDLQNMINNARILLGER